MLYRLPFVAAILLLIAGCSAPGITYTNQLTGETVRVNQPPKSIAPATLRRGNLTASATQPSYANPSALSIPLEISTGQQQERDYATEGQTKTLTWVGIALILGAVASVVLRAYLPSIPLSASLLMGGVGVLFQLLPGLVEHSLAVWSILAGVAGLYALGLFDNRHKLAGKQTPATATPPSSSSSPASA